MYIVGGCQWVPIYLGHFTSKSSCLKLKQTVEFCSSGEGKLNRSACCACIDMHTYK